MFFLSTYGEHYLLNLTFNLKTSLKEGFNSTKLVHLVI